MVTTNRRLTTVADMDDADRPREELIAELNRLRRALAGPARRARDPQEVATRANSSGRKYRLMVEKAKEAFLAIQNDRIRFFNHRALELTGLSKEALITRNFVNLFHPGDRSRLISRFHCENEILRPFKPEAYRILCSRNEARWVELNVSPIAWDGAAALLVGMIDRTERIQAEEALKESEARYRTLFEHADDAIFLETENREIVDINRRACEMFGYSRQELLRMKTSDLFFRGEGYPSIYANPALSTDMPAEIEGRHCDGRRFPIEYTLTPLVSGRKTIFMSIMRDCTERKKSEEARVIQEKLEAILEMTGAVCHELSQPMMAIYGYTELVGMKMSKDDPLYRQILKISEQVDRMGRITAKLMRIARYKTRGYLEGTRIIDIEKSSD
jgi:PAS domain S-box-containing protein